MRFSVVWVPHTGDPEQGLTGASADQSLVLAVSHPGDKVTGQVVSDLHKLRYPGSGHAELLAGVQVGSLGVLG